MNKSQVFHIIGGSIVGLLAGLGIGFIILIAYFVLFGIPGSGVVGGIMIMVCGIIGGILGDRHWAKHQETCETCVTRMFRRSRRTEPHGRFVQLWVCADNDCSGTKPI